MSQSRNSMLICRHFEEFSQYYIENRTSFKLVGDIDDQYRISYGLFEGDFESHVQCPGNLYTRDHSPAYSSARQMLLVEANILSFAEVNTEKGSC